MKRVKDAKYFINKVIKENHSKNEWLALRDEIKVWLRDAPADQKDEFIKRGNRVFSHDLCSLVKSWKPEVCYA